jgi:uncharacterized protein with ParB-like and HNH nuclease domain
VADGFQTPITIKTAMDKIHNREYLLPDIQRKFEWTSTQIERLFDSILLDYPINSFMMWAVKDNDTKADYNFYEFLKEFRETFKTDNPYISTVGVKDFEAVMDGQQRLTSIYIGLHGSYAYRVKRGSWSTDDEKSRPTRQLFLNLSKLTQNHEDDNTKQYDFRFLSKAELLRMQPQEREEWFKVGDILVKPNLSDIITYINKNEVLKNNIFALETITKLWNNIWQKPLINYYLLDDSSAAGREKVLDIFIRTNKGGTQLTNAMILQSIITSTWSDARPKREKLKNEIQNMRPVNFSFDEDYIVRTCLVLFSKDVKYNLKNMTKAIIKDIETHWTDVAEATKAAFLLISQIGFTDKTLRAKIAVIPLIYYIYKNKLADKITTATYFINNKTNIENIRKWLSISFLKGIFSGQTDRVLTDMRRFIDEKIQNGSKDFPFIEIKNGFSGSGGKSYRSGDEYIDELLKTRWTTDSTKAHYILLLLFPNLDYYNQDFHLDHMHPKSWFTNENIIDTFSENEQAFAQDPINWDSIKNLQLLNGLLNSSKKATDLQNWANTNAISNSKLLVDDNISLDIKDFKEFIGNREKNLKRLLTNILT